MDIHINGIYHLMFAAYIIKSLYDVQIDDSNHKYGTNLLNLYTLHVG